MTTKHIKNARIWHVALWVGQILLAAMFLMVGVMKTFVPLPELTKMIPLAAEMPGLIRFIGMSELAGGVGLLLPAALRIRPQLTVLAATALGVVMVLALIFHVSRGEWNGIGTNIMLALIAGLIAWGRTYRAPIRERKERIQTIVKT